MTIISTHVEYSLRAEVNQIQDVASWEGDVITYSMTGTARASADYTADGQFNESKNVVAMTDHQVEMANVAFNLWDDLIAPDLVLTTDKNADITFNYSNNLAELGGRANMFADPSDPTEMERSYVWIPNSNGFELDSSIALGTGYFRNYIHEIGHALGLLHPGPYNSGSGDPTYADAVYAKDTLQYTIMSYWNPDEYDDAVDHIVPTDMGIGYEVAGHGVYISPQTPMIHDIAAVQDKYGADLDTRSDATVYGFNTNTNLLVQGHDPDQVGTTSAPPANPFDFARNTFPVLAIWDAGGIDTLDLSGFDGHQLINLAPGSFSSVGNLDMSGNATELNNNLALAIAVDAAGRIEGLDDDFDRNTVVNWIENAVGGSGNDTLLGNDVNNTLRGGAGRDVLDGKLGLDALYGGLGDDAYYLNDLPDIGLYDFVMEQPNEGIDTVFVGLQPNLLGVDWYALTDNVEMAVVTGDKPFDVIGNTLDNKFYGNAAANTFNGGGGRDVVDYAQSDGAVDVSLANQDGNAGGALGDRFIDIEDLAGTDFSDRIEGDAKSNNLWGYAGDDFLDGGAGIDGMDGGEGTDTFVVENGDVAIGGAGVDTIQADFDRAAGGVRVNVFRDGSVLTSEATAVSAMGVETIFGMAGDDWIDASRLGTDEGLEVYGQGGSDTFVNGAGKDSFFGGAGTDAIVYSGPSSNYLVRAIGTFGDEFTIQDRTTGVVDDIHGVERVRFGDTETAATGFITTNQSFDGTTQWGGTIVGGSGIDTVSYANANSAIYVDLMREGGYAQALNAQQWDQHVTAVENLTGATNFINYMMGDNRDNVLTGGENLDWLAGRGGSNTLDGRGGYDIVDYYEMTEAVSIDLTTGKAVHSTGTDTLISIDEIRGTNRSDTFVGDALNNYFSGMGGNDIARGGGGADILVGYDGDDIFYGEEGDDALSGETDNDTLYGGAGNDTLDGGAGNDTLSGGSGQNTLTGGLGDDVYLVDSAADVIVETAGQGSDRVVTSVSYTLSAGAEIEAFAAAAGTTALNLTGNEFANAITGNGGANMLNGGLGRDVLTGLGGSDSFVFNTALGANNIDTIADYAKGERILLDDAIFTRVGAVGQLTGAAFYSGTAAHDADDRIIYNAKTGEVFYDADGTGATAAVQFATVTGQPALHAADFWII